MKGIFRPRTLFLIVFTIILIWFRNRNMIAGAEDGVIFYNLGRSVEFSSKAWIDYGLGLPGSSFLSRLPTFYVLRLLNQVGLDSVLLQAILFFLPMFIGMVSMYLLAQFFFGNKHPGLSFLVAVFYFFNPYSMSQIWGRGIYFSYFAFALLPLGLYLFIKGLANGSFKYLLLFEISTLALSWAFEQVAFVVIFWGTLSLFVFNYLLTIRNKEVQILSRLCYFVAAIFIWLVLHSWWLSPLFGQTKYLAGLAANYSEFNLSSLIGVSKFFSFGVLIRLLQSYFFFSPGIYGTVYKSVLFNLISWIQPLLLIFGIIYLRKFKYFVFLLSLLLIGVFVSLGANPPLGKLFIVLFKTVPLMSVFRNPYEKAGLALVLAYSFFWATGFYFIFKALIKIRKFLLIYLIVFFVLFHWPIFTGSVLAGGKTNTGVKVPLDYDQARDYLKKLAINDRILMVPIVGEGIRQEWGNTIYDGADSSSYMFDSAVISNIASEDYNGQFISQLRKNLYQIKIADIMPIMRTSRLIVRKDVLGVNYNQVDYATKAIYEPTFPQRAGLKVCSGLSFPPKDKPDEQTQNCPIGYENSDWRKFNFLNIGLNAETIPLEIAVENQSGARQRWAVGRDDYFPSNNSFFITLPLFFATENYENFDFSNIKKIEIKELVGSKLDSVKISGVWLDSGNKINVNDFELEKTFGKLDVYKPINEKSLKEIETMNKIVPLGRYLDLFKELERPNRDKTLFLVTSQNKNSEQDGGLYDRTIDVLYKKNSLEYWIRLRNGGRALLVLFNSFNPGWKIIPGVEQKSLENPSLISLIGVVRKEYLDESNHKVAFGYANSWVIDSQEKNFAVVYLPQLYADIGLWISKIASSLLLVYFLISNFHFRSSAK